MAVDVLFICHTQYQAMVSAVKALTAPAGFSADFWLSDALPAREELAQRLQKEKIAGRVFLPRDNAEQYPSLEHASLLMRRTMAFKHAAAAGFPLRLGEYREICIYNDWNSAGRYLQDRGVQYVLGEDTYSNLDHPNHWIDDQAAEADLARRQLTGSGYLFWGAYRGVSTVEVANPETVSYYPGKLRGFDVFAHLESLDGKSRAALRRVMGLEILWGVIACALIYAVGGFLIQLITGTENAEIIGNGVMAMRISLPFFPILGVLLCLRTAMQAMGYKAAPVVSSCLELLLKWLSAALLIPAYGYLGTCVTEPLSWVVMTAFLVTAYLIQRRKIFSLPETPAA